MAVASALVMTGAVALSACSGGAHPAAGPASPAITAPAAVNQPAGSPSTTAAPAGVPAAAAPVEQAVSAAQLSELDQNLSDASGSLGAADQDVAHNEEGDANP